MKFIYWPLMAAFLAACSTRAFPSQAPKEAPPTQYSSAPSPVPTLPSAVPTATLEPILFPAPKMEAGSQFQYVDGALLDAVPNRGRFLMGAAEADNPQHQVAVSDFWIYSTEVTNQMYGWCVKSGKCTSPHAKDNPSFSDPISLNYPVVGVNWQQASDYCSFVHGRLPTEAEWEKAASWDPTQNFPRNYPWGQDKPVCDLLNIKDCVKKVAPVINYDKGRSYYGALNMEGNVYEWVADWYNADYYAKSPAQDPLGPETGTRRSYRSSAFDSEPSQVPAALRHSAQPGEHRNDLGFRCVVQNPVYFAPFCARSAYYQASTADSGSSDSLAANKPCPDPSLTITPFCATGGDGEREAVNITVNNSSPTIVSVNGLQACTPASNDVGAAHQCRLGLPIQVNASCTEKPGGQPACPPDYHVNPDDPNQCIASGGAGVCPAGYQLDYSLKCCSPAWGVTHLVPLCAVGQHYYNGVCVDDLDGPWEPTSITYTTNSGMICPGTSACRIRPETCDKGNLVFDPVACRCRRP